MPDQILDQFDHFPDYIWDAILTAVAIVGKGIGARHGAICQVPPKSGESACYGS